jgi:hypothetical protein
MKRFCIYNGIVALVLLAVWLLLAITSIDDAIVCVVMSTFVFGGFYFASMRALRERSKHPVHLAVLASVLISPFFIVVGIFLAVSLRSVIRGHT